MDELLFEDVIFFSKFRVLVVRRFKSFRKTIENDDWYTYMNKERRES